MESQFNTLQEFMLHAESITYIVLALGLVGFVGFWFFLTGKDDG